MKELYTSPVLELLCLASSEKLASGIGTDVEYDDLFNPGGGSGGGISGVQSDVPIPL